MGRRARLVARGAVLVALLVSAQAAAHGPAATEPADSDMTTVYLVLLRKGPAWTADKTPHSNAIQEAHMANIRQMWRSRKLIVAGPTEDDADLRGVFVFKVGSLEEAKALAASDPAVKAGRLVAMVYPWWVEKRVLPEPGSFCAPAPAE